MIDEEKIVQDEDVDFESESDNENENESEEELSQEIKRKYEYVYGELIQDGSLKETLLTKENYGEDEALGFVRASYFCVGELKIDSKGTTSVYSFRNGLVSLKFCESVKRLCSYSPEVGFVDPQDKRRNRRFVIVLPEKITFELLTRLGVISVNKESKKIERMVSKIGKFPNEEYRRGFFLMLYLECGKLSYYGDYKLNFTLETDIQAKKFAECFKREQFSAGLIQDKPMVFLKGEKTSNFLALIGATREALVLSDYYCKRSATRLIRQDENWKLANYDRQLTASANQLVAIKSIREANMFGLLADDLKELALLRENNPEISILEISKMLGISKSTAHRKMERIIEFSKDIKKK